MHFKKFAGIGILIFAGGLVVFDCSAAEQNAIAAQPDLQALQAEIAALKTEYEKRIKQLEARLEELQIQMLRGTLETEAPPETPGSAVPQKIAGALNPAISVIGNLLGRADSQRVFGENGERIDNKILLREVEIDMRVPVDPYADGILIMAIESETPGQFSAGVEEGYVSIKKLPFLDRQPLGLKLKAGRFRPLFGNVNILHTHDLPQSFRPLVIQEFLGPEGFVKDGISANFFVPAGWENSSLDLTLEAFSGGDIAVSPNAGSRMSYLGHLRYFGTIKNSHNLQLGWSSYLQPKGNSIRETDIHGVDFFYRWKPVRRGEWQSFIIGSEFIFGRRAYPGGAEFPDGESAIQNLQPVRGKPLGHYVFTQYQFNNRTYAGVRWDRTGALYDPSIKRSAVTPYVSYYFSEFLRFRLNYEHRWSGLVTDTPRNSAFAELNFVFGSHPPEPFWVNK